jgi:hypothetical protein
MENETITIPLDLFERLVTAAECLAKGYRLTNKDREIWRIIKEKAQALAPEDEGYGYEQEKRHE